MIFDFQKEIPFPAPTKPKFKFIDLFAGIGGFRLAMQNLGGKCVYTSEWDEQAKKTYQVNFGEVPFGDITKEETKKFIPDNFDVLCAGFPCQAFQRENVVVLKTQEELCSSMSLRLLNENNQKRFFLKMSKQKSRQREKH